MEECTYFGTNVNYGIIPLKGFGVGLELILTRTVWLFLEIGDEFLYGLLCGPTPNLQLKDSRE